MAMGKTNTISNCFNSGNVFAKLTNSTTYYTYAGGIMGYTAQPEIVFDTCYNSGTPSHEGGKDARNGGIIGAFSSSVNTSGLKNCGTTTDTLYGYKHANAFATDCTTLITSEAFATSTALIVDYTNTSTKFNISSYAYLGGPNDSNFPGDTTSPGTGDSVNSNIIIYALIGVLTIGISTSVIVFVINKRAKQV